MLLAGDAGGFVNGFSAEGIYYAMVTGELAADAIPVTARRDGIPGPLGRGLRELWLERDHATLAEHRLEQDQRRVAGGRERRRLERLDLVGVAKVTPGRRGPKPSHLAGWPVAERAPSVRPWRPPSSATIRVLPVALRAIFSASLVCLGPRFAKERPPALEALKKTHQPQHRLIP